MALLDISVVNLSIPELQTALGTGIDSVSWLITLTTSLSPRCCSPRAGCGPLRPHAFFLIGLSVLPVGSALCAEAFGLEGPPQSTSCRVNLTRAGSVLDRPMPCAEHQILCARLELALADPEREWDRDVIRLAVVAPGFTGNIDLTRISQPWLRDAAAQWLRLRLIMSRTSPTQRARGSTGQYHASVKGAVALSRRLATRARTAASLRVSSPSLTS